MLWADKRALETNLKVQLLQIRERELEFYVRNTLTICVVATIILGFSYTMMTEAVPSDYAGVGPYAVRVLYMVSCMSSLGSTFSLSPSVRLRKVPTYACPRAFISSISWMSRSSITRTGMITPGISGRRFKGTTST